MGTGFLPMGFSCWFYKKPEHVKREMSRKGGGAKEVKDGSPVVKA